MAIREIKAGDCVTPIDPTEEWNGGEYRLEVLGVEPSRTRSGKTLKIKVIRLGWPIYFYTLQPAEAFTWLLHPRVKFEVWLRVGQVQRSARLHRIISAD